MSTSNTKVIGNYSDIVSIADAVRNKIGTTDKMSLGELINNVNSIDTGGNTEIEDGLITKNITECSNDRVTSVGDYAFYYCSLLTSAYLPSTTTIGDWAFYGCSSLESIDAPLTTTIDEYAFYECTSLTSANLVSATAIGDDAFHNCSSLISANFPVATSIGDDAFISCEALSSVNIPLVTNIGYETFGWCTSLTSVSLPSATSIGSSAFQGCSALRELYLSGDFVCKLEDSSAFDDTPMSGSIEDYEDGECGYIYVPPQHLTAYQNAQNWSSYSDRFKVIDGMFYIAEVNKQILSFDTTKPVSLTIYGEERVPNVTIESSDNSVVSVSNIVTTSENITFDIMSHQVEATNGVDITITIVYDDKTEVRTFTVNVFELMPEPTYTVESLDSEYGFVLNSNSYYESNNQGQDDTFAMCKVNINAPIDCTMHVDCINYAENNYDYGILSNLDEELTFNSDTYNDVYKHSFAGNSSEDVQTVSYDVSAGEHYIYVKYIKDSSSEDGNDSLQFKIRFEI